MYLWDEAEFWLVICSYMQEYSKLALYKLEEDPHFPPELYNKDTVISDSQPSELWEIIYFALQAILSLWYVVKNSQEDEDTWLFSFETKYISTLSLKWNISEALLAHIIYS